VSEIKRCCMDCIYMLYQYGHGHIEYDHMVCDKCNERTDFVEVTA
jgi:hypothetical protein